MAAMNTDENSGEPEPTITAEGAEVAGPDLAYLRIYEEPTGFSDPAPFDESQFEPGMSAEERLNVQQEAEE